MDCGRTVGTVSPRRIDIICANSPQAKGRIERAVGTLQDRMVKELRLAGISSIAAANAFVLPTFGGAARLLAEPMLWPIRSSSEKTALTRRAVLAV